MKPELSSLGFPVPQEVTYSTTPLTLALCQVSFPPILSMALPEYIGSFQSAIQDEYPHTVIENTQNMSVNIDQNEIQATPSSTPSSWRFNDLDDQWSIVIGMDFFTLETRGYSHFVEFNDRLVESLGILYSTTRPGPVRRVGLRYVNEIRSSLAWSEIINPRLLGALDDPTIGSRVVQAFQQIVLRGDDQSQANLHHGAFPTGSVVAPQHGQQSLDIPFYLLDIDVWREFDLREPILTPDAVIGLVDGFHRSTWSVFRWSVSESYLATLGRQ